MKFSKVIYFLIIGTILAAIALLVIFDQQDSEDKKEVIVPLVKEVVDANPILVKPSSREQTADTIKLEVIRVRPDGSLVIAGKGLPNSKVEIISGAQIIAETNSDKIGDFVAVPEKQLKGGEYLLSFKQTTQDGKVVIANKSVAINVTGAIKDIPIVAIVDSKGKLGAKVIQAPGLTNNKQTSKEEGVTNEDKRVPHIAILAITHDTKVGQLVLSGRAHNGVQINAGFSGKETSSTKIVNDEWNLSIPGKLIAGKQKIFAVLLGKNGKVLSENSIIIRGKTIQNANGKTFVVVQKGDALWNIAYQRLGLGNRYIDIVNLNKNKIINPDLIFPKQLFIIPNKVMN